MDTQKVYGLIADHGDGSSGIRWFRNKELVDKILDDDEGEYEEYYMNEGSPAEELTFPATLDLSTIGFSFFDDNVE